MPTTLSAQDFLGEVTPVGEPDDIDVEAYTLALLNSDIPEPEKVIAPRYYIDFYSDPTQPVYFENGITYPITYNRYTGTYVTLASGRLIVFAVDEREVLVKTGDYDLRVHMFSFADIYSPHNLTSVLEPYAELTVDQFIELLGVGELFETPYSLRNLETILAHVFGRPKYKWGWYQSGCDWGLEVVHEQGEMRIRLVDEETISSRIPTRRRGQPEGTPQQLEFMTMDLELSAES